MATDDFFYNIKNTTLEITVNRVSENKTQRLALDLKCRTHLEILITPLNNNWGETRLVGTDENYICIGVIDYGCYPFSINQNIGVGYVSTKLGLPYEVAECLTIFINKFFIKLNKKKYEQSISSD